MNETWTKRLLLGSAAWNITGGVTSLAESANHFAQMHAVAPAVAIDPLLMYFYQCTWINVLAWGGGLRTRGVLAELTRCRAGRGRME